MLLQSRPSQTALLILAHGILRELRLCNQRIARFAARDLVACGADRLLGSIR